MSNDQEGQTVAVLTCCKCGVPLEQKPVTFNYLGSVFNNDLPVCPVCGQVYVSRELAKGKMAEVEFLLEDK